MCQYIDLPLQHASAVRAPPYAPAGQSRDLRRAPRTHPTALPDVTLRTTFIVGFPGETEDDVAQLEAFVRDTGFDHVGVFTYSHEEGTRAHAMDDDVPASVKKGRRDRIMRLQKQIVARRRRQQIGQVVPVIVDGPSPDSRPGHDGTDGRAGPGHRFPAWCSRSVTPANCVPGRLVTARITGARGYDLVADAIAGVTGVLLYFRVVLTGKALVVGPCPLFAF